jgi:hypothetical protein
MYNIYWWRDMGYRYNFGDEIVPYLFKKLFDVNLEQPCSKTDKNMLVSVGSLLWMSNINIEFWGTGILSLNRNISTPKKIHAVRGLFSQQKLFENNIDCPNIYGDPSVLLPIIYYPNQISKQYKLGIIPHVCDYEYAKKTFTNNDDILILNLRTNDIELIINQILSCEKTVSSSLHGIIASVVYNIPTRWVKFSNELRGDGIKFYDFFSCLDSDVFNSFDYTLFKTKNDVYNPIFSEDVFKFDAVLYPTHNINITDVYRSCPIKN